MGLTIGKETLQLGAHLGGGIVVYIDASGKHGLIAADRYDPISPWNADTTYLWDSGTDWDHFVNDTDICTSTVLLVPPETITLIRGGSYATSLTVWSTGLGNTNVINSYTSATHIFTANALCLNYNGGGYTDWYLPSKDELNKLYIAHTFGIGGFVASLYWSSSEYSATNAWYQDFNNGGQGYNYKATNYYVRAVRSF